MVAVDTSNHLTLTSLKIQLCIPGVHISTWSTAEGDVIWNKATGEFPSAILTSIIMNALYSCNVLVCWFGEVVNDTLSNHLYSTLCISHATTMTMKMQDNIIILYVNLMHAVAGQTCCSGAYNILHFPVA